MSRYELCKFHPAPDPELICGICMNVLDTPYETKCRHVFCWECILTALRENSKCPICRAPCKEDELKEVLPLVQNLINKLTMKCDNYDNGCVDLILKEFFLDHLKSCEFAIVQCRYTKCGQNLLRRFCEEHETKICIYRDHLCEGGCGLMVPQENLDSHSCIEALLTLVKDLKEKNVELQKSFDELKQATNDVKLQSLIPVSDSQQGDLSSSVIIDDGSFSISPETLSSYEWSETEMTDLEYESYRTGHRRSRRLAMLDPAYDDAPHLSLSDSSNHSDDENNHSNDENNHSNDENNHSNDENNHSNDENDHSNDESENIRLCDIQDIGDDSNVDTFEYQIYRRENVATTIQSSDPNNTIDSALHTEVISPTRTPEIPSIVMPMNINCNTELYIDGNAVSPEGCSNVLDDSNNSPTMPDSSDNCAILNTNTDQARPEKRPFDENCGVSDDHNDIKNTKRARQSPSLEYIDAHSEETVLISESSSVSNTSNSKPAVNKDTRGHKRKLESNFIAANQTLTNSESDSTALDEVGIAPDQTSDTLTPHRNPTSEPFSPDDAVNASTSSREGLSVSSSRRGPMTRSQGHDQHDILETHIIQNVKVPPSMAYLLDKYAQDDDSSSDESWSPSHDE